MILKKLILITLLLSSTAYATVNTLTLVDEYVDGDSKICIYSNGHRTETFIKDGAGSCPRHKTFD